MFPALYSHMRCIAWSLWALLLSCSSSADRRDGRLDLSEERTLVEIPVGRSVWRQQISPDGRLFAVVLAGGKRFEVIWNGDVRQEMDHHCELTSGSTGGWIASATWGEQVSTFSVNGREVWQAEVHPPYCALDARGRIVAVVGKAGRNQVVVSDGKPSNPWPRINRLIADAAGRRIAYSASKDGADWLVEADRVSGPFEKIRSMQYPTEAGPLLVVVEDDDQSFIRVGDRDLSRYDLVGPPTLARDGKTVVYGAEKDGKWIVVVGDRELPALGKRLGAVAVSADLRLIAYGTELNGSRFMIIGDQRVGPFMEVGSPCFSGDERRVGFGAVSDREVRWKVVEFR